MKYIDEVEISGKIVLMRVDFNVPLSASLLVEDDQRIKASIPSIKYLLGKKCKIVLISHLGRPEGMANKLSLKPVARKLQQLIPGSDVKFIDDLTQTSKELLEATNESLFLLENIRFYPEEQENDPEFSKTLSSLADVYVNDAFSVSHRSDSSVVGVAKILPSYGGLLLKNELSSLKKLLSKPEKPFVAILGGSKISTKLLVIERLSNIVDTILVGGGIANTLLAAQGHTIGKSISEKELLGKAKDLIESCRARGVSLILPTDVVVGEEESTLEQIQTKSLTDLESNDNIYDIGLVTRRNYSEVISKAKTIIWNGPVGYFENPAYIAGTDSIYTAIVSNQSAFSVAGGGDTLSYLTQKSENERLSFISTGGGAMLEYLAKGTLPGIEALT